MIVGGSGFRREYLDLALEYDVDAFVSGELRHDVVSYSEELCLFDATHYATEAPAMRKLCKQLPLRCVFIEHQPTIRIIPYD